MTDMEVIKDIVKRLADNIACVEFTVEYLINLEYNHKKVIDNMEEENDN